MNRIMAIDYGDARIGLSLSDPDFIIAHPLKTINRDFPFKKTINEICEIAIQNSVSKIVVGMPINLKGEIGSRGKITLKFIEKLKNKVIGGNLKIKVDTWDERMSTVLAYRLMNESRIRKSRKKEIVDSVAATVILQSYLDNLKNEDKRRMRILTVFGTRPEAIKMAPLVKELEKHRDKIESKVCVSAQHRSMLDQVLDFFEIEPDYDLNIMQKKQNLKDITINILELMEEKVFSEFVPDIILVHGDTATAFATALSAFYHKIKVGHVEAGLRTNKKYFPYPEEMNRKLIGSLADLHFCPTQTNKQNLIEENTPESNIFITGNTVIDSLKYTVDPSYEFQTPEIQNIDFDSKIVILVTAHRRENFGEPIKNIAKALNQITEIFEDVIIIYPVHPNPNIKEVVSEYLQDNPRIILTSPLNVIELHNLMAKSYLILTDSGGLQEEAPSLGKPVLVLRNETERPEAVIAGTIEVVGTDFENIVQKTQNLLYNREKYDSMSRAINPYGDGFASRKIVEILLSLKN